MHTFTKILIAGTSEEARKGMSALPAYRQVI
jgi:hypothetical protein